MKTKKEYRTESQFQEIVLSAYNGNWSTAYKEAEAYAFYANDLIIANAEAEANGRNYFTELTDIALIVEGACKIREQKSVEYLEKLIIRQCKK